MCTQSPLTKAAVLEIIADVAEEVYAIDRRMAARVLNEREDASSTGMGEGIALPHARSPEFDRIVGIFIKLDTPTAYASPDNLPVDLLFCIFAPDTNSVVYLQSLGNVARTLRSETIRRDLRQASDPAVIHAILTREAE
ncbi:MAG: PTS sugar transporter subunit IIA [Rhodobacteraceae bacterium]|nr:PTS sugar transporter subunit IIA [Paracoccaceae bacterium]